MLRTLLQLASASGPASLPPEGLAYLRRHPWMKWDEDARRVEFDIALTPANLANPFVSDRFDYIHYMYVGVDTPNGFVLGTFIDPAPGRTFSITGDTSGIGVDADSGELSVTDATQITEAGVRSITLVVSDAGSFPFTVTVVDGTESIGFIDSAGDDGNTGKQPHLPKATFDWAALGNPSIRCIRRGSTYTGDFAYASNTTFRGYGDPSEDRPEIYESDPTALIAHPPLKSGGTSYTSTVNVKFEDINFRGGMRGIHAFNSNGMTVLRCDEYENNDGANAQGFHFRTSSNVVARHCKTERAFGDGLYGTKVTDVRAAFCDFGEPDGSGADCLQITHEGAESQRNADVWVHDCIFRQAITTTSLKGAVVIQGTDRWLFESCFCEGKYFGLGAVGTKATARNSYFYKSRLPTSSGNYGSTWGLGIGTDQEAYEHSYYDNFIDEAARGIIVSGFDAPEGGWQRYDMLILHNTVVRCDTAFRITEPASGLIKYNLFAGNANNTIQRIGNGLNAATGGVYATLDTTENTFAASVLDLGDMTAVMSGTRALGQTVTVAIEDAPVGATATPQWRLNGLPIAGATGTEYLLPMDLDLSLQERMPAFMSSAELSCVILVESGGVSAYLPAVWEDSGRPYAPFDYPPEIVTDPFVTGLPFEGEVLSCTTGSWTNDPTGYSYQWYDEGVAIEGETGNTYTFASGDVEVTCVVTATNIAGSDTAESNAITDTGTLESAVTGSVFEIVADNAASYAGSGQTWASVIEYPADGGVMTAGDFWLGASSSSSTDDPTFIGTPGDSAAHFLVDGGDFASIKANTDFCRRLFLDANEEPWWAVALFDLASIAGTNNLIYGNSNSSASMGMNVRTRASTGNLELLLNNGSTSNISILHASVGTGPMLHVLTFNNATKAWKSALNSRTFATGTASGATCSTQSTTLMSFGAAGKGTPFIQNGSKLKRLGMGLGELNDTDLGRIVDMMNARYSLGIS